MAFIPAVEAVGEWKTFDVKASDLGLAAGDKVAMMGLIVENTPANYELRVSEMALRDNAKDLLQPLQQSRRLRFSVVVTTLVTSRCSMLPKEESGWEKTYNDEVGTWYYEIYFQQKDQPVQLLTATTSWAAYVVDAPMVSGADKRDCRFCVRAVSPDGKKGS